jgi:hypothetical protein
MAQIAQHLYTFILLGSMGFWMLGQTMGYLISDSLHTTMPPEMFRYRLCDIITSLIFYMRWFVLPVYLTGSLSTLLQGWNSPIV